MKDPQSRTIQSLLSFFALISLLIVASCGGDDPEPAPKSSAKSIVSFKFSGLSPEVTGTISESQKTIAATVPAGTNVSALSPTITVSEKATISPASGAAQNFANPVTYTVTAEDGTTQTYTVTVTILEAPSSEKSITSFTFADFDPQVVGDINEDAKTISIMVPNGTDVTELAPTIEVSAEALVSPISGDPQDFSTPVTYTVTAEDGTTQTYVVTVTIDPTVDFTLDEYTGSLELAQGETLQLAGDNFGNYITNGIVMIDEFGVEYTLDAEATSTDELLIVLIPSNMPTGEYQIRVFIGTQSVLLDETFTVVFNDAEITGIDPNPVIRGEQVTITGNYFTFNIEVFLVDGEMTTQLDIVESDEDHIVVVIPAETTPKETYQIRVRQNGVDVDFGPLVVEVQAGIPFISEIDQSSYNRGETMVFTGVNLKKEGAITNINFIPFIGGGPTIVRTATSVNAEGTEVTFQIPNDFPTGTYSIAIEVDLEFSDEYRDIILIE